MVGRLPLVLRLVLRPDFAQVAVGRRAVLDPRAGIPPGGRAGRLATADGLPQLTARPFKAPSAAPLTCGNVKFRVEY